MMAKPVCVERDRQTAREVRLTDESTTLPGQLGGDQRGDRLIWIWHTARVVFAAERMREAPSDALDLQEPSDRDAGADGAEHEAHRHEDSRGDRERERVHPGIGREGVMQ